MSTEPSNTPIPSELPRDLKFNAGKMDEIVNSPEESFSDRFGKARITWAGIENLSKNQLERLENMAHSAIAGFGYITIDSFEDGATINEYNEVLRLKISGEYYRWDGELPKAVSSGSTPESTGGIGVGAWLSVGDATLRGDLSSSGGASLVNFTGPQTGQVATPLYSILANDFNIVSFGARPDNTDITAALQAAVTACSMAGRGRVYIPAGRWRIEGAVTVGTNVTIEGAGIGATEIYYVATNQILFDIGDGVSNPNNVFIRNLRINVVNTSTSSYLIRFRNGYNCGVQFVRIDGAYWNALQMLGGSNHFIYKIQDVIINGKSTSNNSIVLGDAALGTVRDVFMNNIVLGGTIQGAGILHQWSSGVYASNIDVISAKYGIAWIPEAGSGGNCVGSFYSQVLADTCQQHGFIANPPSGCRVNEISMTGCWGSSNGTEGNYAGLFINGNNGTVANFAINGFVATNNKGSGVQIQGENAYGIVMNGTVATSNSMIGSNTAHGIYLGPDVHNVQIIGGKCGQNPAFGFNRQAYGIYIASGAGNRLSVIGVDLDDNTTGPLYNGATGAGVYIAACSPYRTANRGSAQIAAGSTSVTINPGINASFSASDVQVSPTTDLAGLRWWLTQSGSTFTINMNTSSTSNMFFSWNVDVSQARS